MNLCGPDPATATRLYAYATVVTWGEGLTAQWGGDPLAEESAKLVVLSGFCEFSGKSPDDLIAYCFLRKRNGGELFVSLHRRLAVADLLRAFLQLESDIEARTRAAIVLSFFIHNGIMMHTGMIGGAAQPPVR